MSADDALDAGALDAGALDVLADLISARVRIVDVTGRILRTNAHAREPDASTEEIGEASAGASTAVRRGWPSTLRELWELQQPTRSSADVRVPFLETPAMRAMSGQRVDCDILRVRHAHGSRSVEVSAVPILDSGGRVVGVLLFEEDEGTRRLPDSARTHVHDEHEMRPAHATRLGDRNAVSKVEPALGARERRMTAIGRVAAGLMHDVNNALNPIMASAFLLRHHAGSPEHVRDYAERIRLAAESGAAIATRVARFVRQQPVHAGGDEAVDLSLLVGEVVNGFAARLASEAAATVTPAVEIVRELDEEVRTRGLPDELRASVENLLQNAVDAMPAGGVLTVRTYVDLGDACIAVQDQGTGMTDDTRDQAFEPFFSTRGVGRPGLGLAEVYGIARRHRGDTTIESEPDNGTVVTMRLPVDFGDMAGRVTQVTRDASARLHVLVVEDHDDGRELLRRMLHTGGHTVDTARNCAEARGRLAAESETSYHLMLTDVGLPDGSGWELAAYAHGLRPALRIGVITGWDAAHGSQDAGVAEFVLRKPLRAAELLARVAGRDPSTTIG